MATKAKVILQRVEAKDYRDIAPCSAPLPPKAILGFSKLAGVSCHGHFSYQAVTSSGLGSPPS
jgi:hypothetical protein